jgi:hypothetical protein
MRGVLVQSKPMRANGADVSSAKASDVTSTAKTAAHMAAATEASAVTATTTTAAAGVGCACQQARGEKSCCHYRDHPFHRDTPFQSDCSAL